MIPLLAPLTFTLLQAAAPGPEALVYRFDEVKRSVQRWPAGDKAKEIKVVQGDTANPGDVVKTGWWGQSVISVPDRNSRFEVYANTQVRLAGGEPGVLLVLDKGRLKAFFQVLVGGGQTERQVAVPGALLAVRGTRYGVEVDKDGKSTLAVFEGVVEILHRDPRSEPIRVKAGEWSTFGPGMLPKVQPMSARGFEEGTWNQGMRPDGSMGSGGMSSGGPMPGGMHPAQSPMQTQGPMHR
jgi:hypothetical protein